MRTLILTLGCLSASGFVPAGANAEDIERAPIHYLTAPENNRIARLRTKLDAKQIQLDSSSASDFLKNLLKEFQVPESSQVLVFSRTSLQRQKICPQTPRAIYFNDDVYVGFCQESSLVELTAVDPDLGAVFYSLNHRLGQSPLLARQNDACLICHASSATRGLPGQLVRSVFPDRDGYPVFPLGTFRVDHRTPLKDRWGGWYVTGQTGDQAHLGNKTYSESAGANQRGQDMPINKRIRAQSYLNPHSDVIALMVLEHQAEMQNLLTRAGFQTRFALYQQAQLYKELGAGDIVSDSTRRRIYHAADDVVKYMLFAEEAKLPAKVEGDSTFRVDFAKAGPRDRRGRSLRDLDFQTRLFKYPCSFLIYSPQYAGLPKEVKSRIESRSVDILSGRDQSDSFAHLSETTRREILEILRETVDGFPK